MEARIEKIEQDVKEVKEAIQPAQVDMVEIQTDIKWIKDALRQQQNDCKACPIKIEIGKDQTYRKMTWFNFMAMMGIALGYLKDRLM